ncbi:hypothetical protein [Sorangium sp. So ce385]|uniref:hypothetical protein n=1 Tax=Sorangium sp. So ce385 TaxID=3133308 RepID=UPI003F5ADEFE
MKMRWRYRFPRRAESRCAAAAVLLGGALVACGNSGGAAGTAAAPPERMRSTADGYWMALAPVPAGGRVIPWGDGKHAWVEGIPDGPCVLDIARKIDCLKKPDGAKVRVFPTKDPRKAWAVREKNYNEISVCLLNFSSDERLQEPVCMELMRRPSVLFPSVDYAGVAEDRSSLWLGDWSPTPRREDGAGFSVVDSSGGVAQIDIPPPSDWKAYFEDLAGKYVSIDGPSKAWVRTYRRILVIDELAHPRVRESAPIDSFEIAVDSTGKRAFVVGQGPSAFDAFFERISKMMRPPNNVNANLYVVDVTNEAGELKPRILLNGANVRKIHRGAGGGRIWAFGEAPAAPPSTTSVYLLDAQGSSLFINPIQIDLAQAFADVSSDRLLVYSGDGQIRLLDDHGIRKNVGGLKTSNAIPLHHPFAGGDRVEDRVDGAPKFFQADSVNSFWLVVPREAAYHVAVGIDSLVPQPANECGPEVKPRMSVHSDGRALWFSDGRALYVVQATEARGLRCLETKVHDARKVRPAGDGMHGWIETERGVLAYSPASEVEATIELDHGMIRLSKGEFQVEQTPYIFDRVKELNVDWPNSASLDARGAIVKVSIHESESGVVKGVEPYEARKEGSKSVQHNSAWPLPTSSLAEPLYNVVIDYEDGAGSKLTLGLEKVRFASRPLDRASVRTLLACVAALLLFLLPVLLEARSRLARGWLPFGAVLASTAGTGGVALIPAAQKLNINFPIVAGFGFGALLLALAASVVSPFAFRLLAPSKPFQWLVPVAVSVPRIRRGLLRDYVTRTRAKLRKKREMARGETYVALPADILMSEGSPPSPAPEALADAIAAFLGDPNQGGNVLIEAPGGRGKSALLRQVMERMLARFHDDPSRPLPVLCEAGGPSLADALRHALEAHALSPEVLEAQLLRGDYVIVIDGLVESPFEPEHITRFLDGPLGGRVRLLLAGRPHDDFRNAFEGSARWMRIEPQMLYEDEEDETKGTLKTFVDAYKPSEDYVLPDAVKEACRSHDGAYLPILIRLAMYTSTHPITTLSDLYGTSIQELLKARTKGAPGQDTALLEWTRSYCLATYWRDGLRAVRGSSEEERKNLQTLREAGLLVQAEDARDLRFFHDSMQSYLTASALFEQQAWDSLHRAAAHPIFVRNPTDLLPGRASELFAMCLFVFGPVERIREELKRQLDRWADGHEDDLSMSKTEIANTMPAAVRGEILGNAAISSGAALKMAVQQCDGNDLRVLGALYASVAVKVWPLRAQGARAVPWDKRESSGLIRLLANAYPTTDDIEHLAKEASIDLLDWQRALQTGKAWRSLLEQASIQHKLDALLDRIMEDPDNQGIHDELRRLRDVLWPA